MNQELLKNNYIVVNNFIEKKRAEKLYFEFKDFYENNLEDFRHEEFCNGSYGMNNPYPFLSLMLEKLPEIGNIVEDDLYPTYSFGRVYENGSILPEHIDRAACEISVTLHLGSDGTDWEIFFKKPNDDVVSVNLEPGQAVIYLGCDAPHWRNRFNGQEYVQVFLHYVRAKGKYNWAFFDKKTQEGKTYGN